MAPGSPKAILVLFLVLVHIALIDGIARSEEEQVLCFGSVPTESQRIMRERWQVFLEDMGKAVGVKIIRKNCDDYAGVVWAMGAGKIHVAMMGNKSAMEAVDRGGGEVALRTVDVEGMEGYWSHLVTNIGSGLSNEKDVLERAGEITFGNGDPNSTSGFVVPGYYLFFRNGVDPRTAFKRVLQANHEENLVATAEGRVDVATSNSIALKRFKTTHPDKAPLVKVIWTSPMIASDPVVWRKSLPEELKSRIRAFFLDYGRASPGKSPEQLAHERSVLADMTFSGFVESSNDQLVAIRQIELFQSRVRIEEDPLLTDRERAWKLKEVEARLLMLGGARQQE